jgi:hypothetical protein
MDLAPLVEEHALACQFIYHKDDGGMSEVAIVLDDAPDSPRPDLTG